MHIETGAVKRRLASKLLSPSAANPRLITQTGEGYEWSSRGSPGTGLFGSSIGLEIRVYDGEALMETLTLACGVVVQCVGLCGDPPLCSRCITTIITACRF